ncbi:uncharacterized protein CTRU02_210356 [Colletotrichum truncatum]|uniref:Uncharacterized protein n=1 Tax=Colletotrichum truncatum TaxID=5467 RepID=A0ACC3YV05_COLTU|nr:uncharacterized protein CTRU02_15307 [Colletotrichum truncatum]KAF6781212.1 hypothetical protein CTRU02_15307 [Colletotrichum truncatum]
MASTTSSKDIRQSIKATTEAFLASFEDSATQGDAAIINRNVTPDCTRSILPLAVSEVFGLPAGFSIDNATFQEIFAQHIKALKFRNGVMSNLVIDTEARCAAFTAYHDVVVAKSEESYFYECSFTLYFNENGSKIRKVVEFLDKDGTVRMANDSK